jgi:formamidopyrimidine-DNA glycosylase
MPELPEVETVARGLAARVTGDVIESVWLGDKPQPLKSPAEEIVSALERSRIAAVRRAGKHIVFDLEQNGSEPRQWVVHLGMTGRLLVSRPEAEVAKHTHAIARLKSGREIRFVDPRRFGRLAVSPAFAAAGAEPLDISLEDFATKFHKSKAPIKSALLNQKLLSGVGNIYADEALFRARVRPRRRACTLTRVELRRLYVALQKVLNEAITAGGTTVSDYVGSDGSEGMFQFALRAYQRHGERCLRCRKTKIKRIVLGGRGTHYCPCCQK